MKYCKNCKNCNKSIPIRNIFCSIECQKDAEYKAYINKWKNNLINGMRGDYQISMHIKKYLF